MQHKSPRQVQTWNFVFTKYDKLSEAQSEAAYLKNKAMLYHNCSLKQGTCAVWYELKTANQTTHKSTNKCNKVITVYEQNVKRTRQAAYLLVFLKSRLKTSLKCSESLLLQTKEWMKKKDKTICYIAEKHRPDVNTQVSYLPTALLVLYRYHVNVCSSHTHSHYSSLFLFFF